MAVSLAQTRLELLDLYRDLDVLHDVLQFMRFTNERTETNYLERQKHHPWIARARRAMDWHYSPETLKDVESDLAECERNILAKEGVLKEALGLRAEPGTRAMRAAVVAFKSERTEGHPFLL